MIHCKIKSTIYDTYSHLSISCYYPEEIEVLLEIFETQVVKIIMSYVAE